MRSVVRVLTAAVLVMGVGSCSDDEPESTDNGSTTTNTAVVSTTASSPTNPTPTATTGPPYGSACAPGSHPDCVDPDGDGQHEYLKGGAECMRNMGDTGLCSDLDDDGVAGYPDSG